MYFARCFKVFVLYYTSWVRCLGPIGLYSHYNKCIYLLKLLHTNIQIHFFIKEIQLKKSQRMRQSCCELVVVAPGLNLAWTTPSTPVYPPCPTPSLNITALFNRMSAKYYKEWRSLAIVPLPPLLFVPSLQPKYYNLYYYTSLHYGHYQCKIKNTIGCLSI